MLVTELGVKWKKADFRKGEQSQTGEAKTPSHPGAVPFELLLSPAVAFLLLGYLESIHPTLLFSPVLLQVPFLLPAKFTSAD